MNSVKGSWFGSRARAFVYVTCVVAGFSGLLAAACSPSNSEPETSSAVGSGGTRPAIAPATEPGTSAGEWAAKPELQEEVRAYVASQQAHPPRYVTSLPFRPPRVANISDGGSAGETQDEVAGASLPPALGPVTKLLSLPGVPSTPTVYPVSADGKYYKVNLLDRTFFPPRASATFSSGVHQLGAAAPPFIFDGKDAAFTAVPDTPGDPNIAVTLTVDMGQYYLVGAVRPLYQPFGGGYPFSQRIRLATKLGADPDWKTVVDAPVPTTDTTLSFDAKPGRYLELTMIGNGLNLLELFVYPAAQTSPPPSSASGYDLTSLGAVSTVNENFAPIGAAWPQSWPAGGFYAKTWNATGDAIGTVDLGAQYAVSRVALGFFWSTPWVNGGRLEVGATPETYTTIADSGLGHDFFPWPHPLHFPISTPAVRYIRATDYFMPGVGPSGGALWSVRAFGNTAPHVGYYSLSADGKYFDVNLLRRPTSEAQQPSAEVSYSNGALPYTYVPLAFQRNPANVFDGDDAAFVYSADSGTLAEATATLTINLGQIQLIGAVRQYYGNYWPLTSSVRVAPTPTGPWTDVYQNRPVTASDSTVSFDGTAAQYVELTMKGTTSVAFANLNELMVYPSSATDPAPSSGGHLDLTYLTGLTYTPDANMGIAGSPWIHAPESGIGYYVKNTSQGGTGDASITVDLGQLFQVSEVDLSFHNSQNWPAGGKLDVDISGTWLTVFDSGRGTRLGLDTEGQQKIAFYAPRTTRYLRLTGYSDPNVALGLLTGIEVFGDQVIGTETPCTPSCAGKICGGDMSNGCGDLCPGVCGGGQSGCTSNSDCAPNLQCAVRSPDPTAPHVCVATTCTPACSPQCPCTTGAACSSISACASGFICTGGVCNVGTNPCHNGILDGDETDVDCGGSVCAACETGTPCDSDSDCHPNEVCGEGNGACFGHPRAERVCWKPECAVDNEATGCGSSNSPCGQNCACVNSCDSTGAAPSTCPQGEVCQKGLGRLFDAPTKDVCLDPRCPSNDPTLCGSSGALCGQQCMCSASCAAATCQNPSDGCGGICPGVCANGEPGCTSDAQCPAGGVCIEDSQGVPTCRPGACAFRSLSPESCAATAATCGECPSCTPRCGSRQCGTDPNCGQSCGTCSAGKFCDGNGQCANTSVVRRLHVPNGSGGQRDLEDLPPSETSTVGALKGQFGVSDEGGAQYVVPIEVPPGRAGMEPALSLNYAGSRMNGDEGIGWHIEGLSKITRCPRSNALDRFAAAVRNDGTDRFCVDGKRLESVTGEYGENATEYRTLVDSFAKVVSYSDDVVGIQVDANRVVSPVLRPLQGPDWFRIWTKDGRILTYGKTQDSLMFGRNGVRYAWLLNRVEDRSGNTILVTYDSLAANSCNTVKAGMNNIVRPQLISYTGHGDTAGNRSVQFVYEDRPDPQLTFFQGGMPFAADRRLKRITTYLNALPVKSYKLEYGSGSPSQVQTISECVGGNDVPVSLDICKPRTYFSYVEESGFDADPAYAARDMIAAGQMDANGDGISDFFATRVTVDSVEADPALAAAQITTDVAISVASSYLTPAGYFAVNGVWALVKGPFWGLFGADPEIEIERKMRFGTGNRAWPSSYIPDVTGIPCDALTASYFFLDYDQDGKDDVMAACGKDVYVARSLAGPGAQCPNCGAFGPYPSSGAVLTTLPSTAGTARRGPRPVVPKPIVLDVNGDSLQDVVMCRDQYTLDLWLRKRPEPGAEHQPFAQSFVSPPVTLKTQDPVAPTNGTQGPARALLNLCGQPSPTYKTFDVDGDGTPDLLARGFGGWVVLRYDVSSSGPALSWQPVTFADVGGKDGSPGGALRLADFNGDGLADIWQEQNHRTIIWLNTGGSQFIAKQLNRPRPTLAVNPNFFPRQTAVVDYNADGLADILENWSLAGDSFATYLSNAQVSNSQLSMFTSRDVPELRAKNEYGVYFAQPFDQTADVDGDGNVDVFDNTGMVFFGRGARNMLLKRVVDGLGNEIDVQYDSSAYKHDEACGTTGSWPEKCLQKVNGLVSSHTEGRGVGVERTYKYSYKNARMNVTGHGWLGFDQRTVNMTAATMTEPVSMTTTIDYEPIGRYGLDGVPAGSTSVPYMYPFAGLPRRITVDQHVPSGAAVPPLQNGLYERRTQTHNFWQLKTSTANRPFPAVRLRTIGTYDRPQQSTAEFENPGSLLALCTHQFEQDGYGNVTRDSSDCQGLNARRVDTELQHDEYSWLISNPEHITILSGLGVKSETYGGAQFNSSRVFNLTYENGLLATVERKATQSEGAASQFRKTTYLRDEFGNVSSITEEANSEPPRLTSIIYDVDHVFPQEVTDADGQTTQLSFDPKWGAPTGIVDGNGVATQTGYDGFGRTKQTVGPDGTSLSVYSLVDSPDVYMASLKPRIEVSVERRGTQGQMGGRSATVYDSYGRPVRTRATGLGGADVMQEQAYDSLGHVLKKTAPHTADVSLVELPAELYSYDYLQRLTRVEHALGSGAGPAQTYKYASSASLDVALHGQWLNGMTCPSDSALSKCAVEFQMSVDEEGHQNAEVKDYLGRVIRNIDGENIASGAHSSNYTYTSWGQLSAALDNNGSMTELYYDTYGRLTTHKDPDTKPGEYKYTYNGFDELKTSLDPKGQLRTYAYDTLGRLRSILDAAGTTQWVYAQGRLTDSYSPGTPENASGQHVHYSYEPVAQTQNRGLLSGVTYTLDGTEYALGFKYDDLGRNHRVEYPDLGTGDRIITQSHYDPTSGALDGLDEIGTGSTKTLWRVTGAFQAHLIQQETFGSGATQATSTYGYDSRRRWLDNLQTTLGSEQIQAIEYTHYDNRLLHTVSPSGAAPREYLYDPLNRLRFANDTPAQGEPVSTPFSYDAIGNLSGRGATVITPKPTKPHLIDSVGSNFYDYDDNGNLLSRTGPDVPGHSQAFEYTPFDLPKAIVSGFENTTGVGTSTVRFEYSADEERVVRRDPDSVRYFVGDLYQRKLALGGTTLEERFRLYAGDRQIGEVVRKGGADEVLFFHADHLGSPDTISSSNGASYHHRFDPFGSPIEVPNPEITRVGFTGQEHDNDLGLIDMKGRVYDPLAGRFTTPDPVTQAPFWSQGLNRYSYVFNNPVNNTDPSGFTAIGDDPVFGMVGWGAAVVGLAAAQGATATAGSIGSSFLTGAGSGALSAGGQLAGTIFGGGLGGARPGAVHDIVPANSPTTNGASRQSPPAGTQGEVGPTHADAQQRAEQICARLHAFPDLRLAQATSAPLPSTESRAAEWVAHVLFRVLAPEAAAAVNIFVSLETYRRIAVQEMSRYYPPPASLPGFPGARRVNSKTGVKGGGGLRRRWVDEHGGIYEWDSQHGRVERYDKRGKHIGEFDADTGEETKPRDKTRYVEP